MKTVVFAATHRQYRDWCFENDLHPVRDAIPMLGTVGDMRRLYGMPRRHLTCVYLGGSPQREVVEYLRFIEAENVPGIPERLEAQEELIDLIKEWKHDRPRLRAVSICWNCGRKVRLLHDGMIVFHCTICDVLWS